MDYETREAATAGKVILFLSGALIGSALSYFFTKRYYSKKADEGVADVLERFGNKDIPEEAMQAMHDCGVELMPNEDLVVYHKALETVSPPEDYSKDDIPVELDEDDFIQDDDYDKETIIYYKKNDVLTDQYDRVLDVNDIFKDQSLFDSFLTKGTDVCYMRNNYLKTDYEVVFEDQDAPETALREGDIDD